jgi:(R,R)-butanediol dehydrogenase/meso-butanediol dehydrogenase/diacetyl reductase
MLAAVYHGKQDIRIEEVPEPTPQSPTDVLLEVAFCGICGTDLHEYTAGPIVTPVEPHPLTGATLPQVLGHEFSARVVEIGSDVRDVAVGDRVSVMPAIVCQRCRYCRRGLGHLCERFAATGLSSATGGLSRYAVVQEYQVAKLPDSVSDRAGAMVEPAAVAAHGVDLARPTGGDIVLISGLGPVGALSALYASAIGAGTVILAEPNPNRAELARRLDVGPVLDPTADDFADAVREHTGGEPVDVAIECSGTTGGLAGCLAQVRRSGTVVQTGLHTRPATLDAMALSEKEVSLVGSWCFLLTDWPRIIRLIDAGKYDVLKVNTSTIELADVVTGGFDALVDPRGSQLKVLVQPA